MTTITVVVGVLATDGYVSGLSVGVNMEIWDLVSPQPGWRIGACTGAASGAGISRLFGRSMVCNMVPLSREITAR